MIEFNVEGMSCSHCVNAVTRAVKALDPGAEVDVDLAGHKVRIESATSREALVAALDEAGYPPN